jgi:N-acetylmuramoyl-L-alanine amidase
MKNINKNKTLMTVVTCLLLVITVTNTALAYTYTVKNGDTLSGISNKTGVPVSVIKSANGMNTDRIRMGQKLSVPVRYTVLKGDTLFKIARKFGVTVADIKLANNLKSNTIKPGIKLWIPDSAVSQPAASVRNNTTLSRGSVNSRDVTVLAHLINAEASGEPYLGKVAVGAVIVNRVKSSKFPNTIQGVIYQIDKDGHYQFSPVLDGRINLQPSSEALRAAREALNGSDPTNGALYFFNPKKTSNQWLRKKVVSTVIGDHVFTF